MSEPTFQIGDTVYTVNVGRNAHSVPCPVCYGTRAVVVILGNGEAIETPCDYCGTGYGAPRGVVEEYELSALPPEARVVTGFEVRGDEVRMYLGCYVQKQDDCFATYDEAVAAGPAAVEKLRAHEAERTAHSKENSAKSYSWHVGYHLRNAAEHRRQAEYHEARAKACKALARTDTPTERS